MDMQKQIIEEIQKGLAQAMKERLTGYSSPLNKLIDQVVTEKEQEIKALVTEAITETVSNKAFREEAKAQIKHKIARELVNSFGEGIFKKTVDKLKSDHTLKARIVVAIENMLESP